MSASYSIPQNQGQENATPHLRVVGDDAKTVRDVLPDLHLDVDLIVPPDYSMTAEATFRMREVQGGTRPSLIANGPILITHRLRDIDTGAEVLRLVWKTDRWHRRDVQRGVAMNTRDILSLADSGFPVHSNNARDVVAYLADFEAINRQSMPIEYTSRHFGWQGDDGEMGYLWGSEHITADGASNITFKGEDDGESQMVKAYRSSGTLEGWIEAVQVAAHHPKVLLALYTAFVPVMLPILDVPNFIVDWSGRTSVGKTTTLRLAASVVGNPDEFSRHSAIASWDTTKVGSERTSAALTGLPVILDDTKRVKQPKMVEDIIYEFSNGRGRTRGKPNGLAYTGSWRSVMLSSGEAPITSFGNAGGSRARVISVKGKPFGNDNPDTRALVNQLNRGVRRNYGHALRLFVRWVVANRDKWDTWRAKYQQVQDEHASRSENNIAGRIAVSTAAITITAALVHKAFRDTGHALPWKYADPITPLWDSITDGLENADTDKRALLDVVDWIESNSGRFLGGNMNSGNNTPTGGWLGYAATGKPAVFAMIYPYQLRKFLVEQGYQPTEVIGGWKERGWIATDKDRSDKQVRLEGQGKRERLIVLLREAVDQHAK